MHLQNAPQIAWAWVWLAISFAHAQEQPRLKHRWELEPDLGVIWVTIPALPQQTLDPSRLSSPQTQLRVDEAQKAIRYADGKTLSGRAEGLQQILKQLKSTEPNRAVQLSLFSAAIKLADASHAAELWEISLADDASRKLLEPVLVEWRSPIALAVWRERLLDAQAPQFDRYTAIEGIGAAGNAQDRPALEALLRDDATSIPHQVAAARALGVVSPNNLEDLAEQITASGTQQHPLLVAELLAHHSSSAARDRLAEILNSDNDPARNVAYSAICRNFPELAHRLAPELIRQADNNLRGLAIAVFHRFDDLDSLRQQALALEDANQVLRNTVRENLEEKAQNAELRPAVDEIITTYLNGESSQGVVQAILLLASLKEKERCPKLVDLLQHADVDVNLTAAWALQELADAPEILDQIHQHTQQLTGRLSRQEAVSWPELMEQAYLFEALGRNRYRPALDMLKIYIPKNGHIMGDFSRAAAIWAIGKIEEGSQDADLAGRLAARMLDQNPDDPEDALVQFMSAAVLGWIHSPTSVNELNKIYGGPPAPLAMARDWSLKLLSQP